ncbi:hypothetical protein L9F63_012290, partial [Diploptera punctata]
PPLLPNIQEPFMDDHCLCMNTKGLYIKAPIKEIYGLTFTEVKQGNTEVCRVARPTENFTFKHIWVYLCLGLKRTIYMIKSVASIATTTFKRSYRSTFLELEDDFHFTFINWVPEGSY